MNSMSAEMKQCIENCSNCHQVCYGMALNHCLNLGGRHTEPNHFRLMMNCAEICRTSADFMLSGSHLHKIICAACAQICDECAKSCREVGQMDDCVQACLTCAESCRKMSA